MNDDSEKKLAELHEAVCGNALDPKKPGLLRLNMDLCEELYGNRDKKKTGLIDDVHEIKNTQEGHKRLIYGVSAIAAFLSSIPLLRWALALIMGSKEQ